MYPHIFSQISHGSLSDKVWEFHRSLLPQKLQKVYDCIKDAIEQRKTLVDVSQYHLKSNDLGRIKRAIHYDCPIFFDHSVDSYYHNDDLITSINLSYQFNDDKYHWYVRKCIERMWELYCDLGLSRESEYMVVKIIHDYLTRNVVWYESTDELRNHSVVGVLLNGTGVCDSIAFTVSMLLNAFGVKCNCISGKDFSNDKEELSDDEARHAWNVVEIESHRGHLDVGFDFNHLNKTKPLYNYFLISDDDCKVTRSWDVQTSCDGENSYFRYYGLASENKQEFEHILRCEINDGMSYIQIKTWRDSTKKELYASCAQILSSIYGKRIHDMKTPVTFDERRKIFTLEIKEA